MEEKIHFSKKRVDESWKDKVVREKGDGPKKEEPSAPEGVPFSSFVTTIGIQGMIHLGEINVPGQEKAQVNLEAAQETIDLLLMLKAKTKGNLNAEEDKLLSSLIAA